MDERYVCIHGHFYQPPRENPWLEAIEQQDSAYPYHDWNERITTECYAANAASRVLDGEGRIVDIVNNYSKISFNVGPTLLAWMEDKRPQIYRAVLEADRESREVFSGHGSAMAQAYNHMIMPLANSRDKYTQALWGLRDFQYRFGRDPEGMWLPETAVDVETLEVLARLGIRFTVLAPHQAARARRIGGRNWLDVTGAQVDPARPYEVRLPSGRRIAVFFYDGPISRAVAFEGLLSAGEHLALRLVSGYTEDRPLPQMVHIATDGETYGHHHRHGDMALAYALRHIESNELARITNYGEYLDMRPPEHQAEIYENTSWSCAHGVERWRSDCGCNSGGHPGWDQSWRAPLRESLDWARDALAPRYEDAGRELLKDPWAARDAYIEVVLDRSPENVDRFLSDHAVRELGHEDRVRALKLLELQRHAMLMYTSCGWFFDELSGIETVQVIQYAGRAIQLAQELFGDSIEPQFLDRLCNARSNIPEHGDGRGIYEKFVRPAMVDLPKVGAHYAVSSIFEDYPESARVYCYLADLEDRHVAQSGEATLSVGRARITSEVTREGADLDFGVFHFGGHNLTGGIEPFSGEQAYQALLEGLSGSFERADFTEIIRLIDRQFGPSTYSLRTLFRDEQRRIVNRILDSTIDEVEGAFRETYDHHAPMMRFLTDLGIPLPRAFQTAADVVINVGLRRALEDEAPDLDYVRSLLSEAGAWSIELDGAGLGFTLSQTIGRLAERFRQQPAELGLLQGLEALVNLARDLPFEVDLWHAQNIIYELLQSTYPEHRDRADRGDPDAEAWVGHFIALAEGLSFRV